MESFLQNVMNLNLLICKRPKPSFETVVIKKDHQKKKSSCQSPFIPCGKVPTQLGKSNHSKENDTNRKYVEKSSLISSINKNNGALKRHRQWLREVQLKRQKLRQDREDALKAEAIKNQIFKENQARKRAEKRESFDDEGIPEVICVNKGAEKEDENDYTRGEMSECTVTKPQEQYRPAWALTEEETENVQHNDQLKEEQSLLEFVDGLNFQDYYDDLELNVLMAQAKDRIRTLEKDTKRKKSKLETIIESQIADNMTLDTNDGITTTELGSTSRDLDEKIDQHNEFDETRSIADSIKTSGGYSVTSIHSQKSLRHLISEAKKSLETVHEGMGEVGAPLPIMITHTDDGGARLAQTKSLNKLPFKNRNPAL